MLRSETAAAINKNDENERRFLKMNDDLNVLRSENGRRFVAQNTLCAPNEKSQVTTDNDIQNLTH